MEIDKREDPSSKGQFVAQTSTGTSNKANRLLQHLNTHISVGTEVRHTVCLPAVYSLIKVLD